MQITRRGFLKLSGATAIGATLAKFGVTLTGCQKYAGEPELRIRYATESTTICPYDATGCGFIVAVEGGTIINIEGDPDHPINRGGACSKGASLAQLRTVDGKLNPRRQGLASVGGAALDNEECYLLVKALRSLGMVYIEHQARI
jgi:formate dehydrogenase major subunit